MFRARGHPDFRERLVHAFAPLLRRQPAVSQRQFDVFPHRQVADEIEALENEADLAVADARALGMVQLCHRLAAQYVTAARSEEHTSELQSRSDVGCRLLLEKKK